MDDPIKIIDNVRTDTNPTIDFPQLMVIANQQNISLY